MATSPESAAASDAPPPLVFRRRYDVPLLVLLLVGSVASAGGWASLLVGNSHVNVAGELYGFLCLAWLGCAAWVLLIFRGEIVLDARGLRYWSLIRREEIPWAEVEKLDVVGGFVEPPALVLRLRRPERFFKVLWLDPCRFEVGLHWSGRERLVSEILAHVPHAQRSEKARARLEAPRRVAWAYRLAPLLGSALAAACFGYALMEAMAWDVASFLPGVLAVAASVLCFTTAGGAIDWEGRWKSWLVRMGGLLGFVVPAAWELAVFLGDTDALVLTLAVCLGWMAATVVVCLPLRLRVGRAALGYALALILAVAPAWWYGVRDPFFSRSTGPLTPGPWQMAWSADGRLLYGLGNPFGEKARPMCHVIDAASLGVATHPLGEFESCWLYPAGVNRVLYRTHRRVGKTSQLWALDPASGTTQLLHTAPWLRVAEEGYLSPDRREAVFLAGTEKQKDAFIVRLSDLAVRKREPGVDLSRFASASWAPDGRMILVERPGGKDPPQGLALWSLAQGEKSPTPFYHAAAPFLAWDLSPDARWAVVATGTDSHTLNHWEVVDLATGKARAIDSPMPSPTHFWRMWSPDGKAFGYPVNGPKSESVFVVDPATGKGTEVHATGERNIAFVALSHGGRYVACAVNRGMAAQGRIIDTRTGQTTSLNRIGALQPLVWFAWSPNQPTLAVASFRGQLRNERPTAIRFYELPP
jgi:hypothetical protein